MKNNIVYLSLLPVLMVPLLSHALTADVEISAGLGYDTNAYRTPADSYVDFFADTTGATTQATNVQSGFFVPLALQTSARHKLSNHWKMIAEYDADTRQYPDSALENADTTDQLLKLGAQYTLAYSNLRSSHIYLGFRRPSHDQTYYDRDTGSSKAVGLAQDEVSDSYSYTASGLELRYDYRAKNSWKIDLAFKQEDRDYTTPTAGSEYDHTYTRLDIGIGHPLSKNWDLDFDAAFYNRDYDLRHARNASGVLNSNTQPLLEYSYTAFDITLKQQVTNALRLDYGYGISQRDDDYVGYNNYELTELSIAGRYRVNNKTAVKLKLISWQQDYPNAWNFDRDPSSFPAITDTANKTAEGLRVDAQVKHAISDQQDIWLELEMRNNDNSDPRYAYDRSILVAGSSWRF